jgi:hypothetical protein
VRNARWVWLAAGGLLVLGCVALLLWFLRGSEPSVTGTVRLDAKPLQKGKIDLIPIDGTPGPGGGGGINKEGQYEITQGLQPGRYRVEISSTITLKRKVLNTTVPYGLVYEEVDVIPEEYNTKSREVREVKPGANVFDFDLKGATGGR